MKKSIQFYLHSLGYRDTDDLYTKKLDLGWGRVQTIRVSAARIVETIYKADGQIENQTSVFHSYTRGFYAVRKNGTTIHTGHSMQKAIRWAGWYDNMVMSAVACMVYGKYEDEK